MDVERFPVQSPDRCHFQVSTNSFQSLSTRIPAADCSIVGRATAWSGRCEKSSSTSGESIEIAVLFTTYAWCIFFLCPFTTDCPTSFAVSSRDLILGIKGIGERTINCSIDFYASRYLWRRIANNEGKSYMAFSISFFILFSPFFFFLFFFFFFFFDIMGDWYLGHRA